jgi:hypothetical protein
MGRVRSVVRDQVLAPLDLVGNIHFRIALIFRSLRQLHQTRNLTPQLRLDLARAGVVASRIEPDGRGALRRSLRECSRYRQGLATLGLRQTLDGTGCV